MPTIIDDQLTFIGDPPHLYKYLCRTKEMNENLYPMNNLHKDKKVIIDSYLEYIQWVIKRNGNKLLKTKIQSILIENELVDKKELHRYRPEDE
jgi:hypothetical protein